MPVQRLAPDLIVTNALIRTLDAADSVARALAAKGGRIVGLGTDDEIAALADGQTVRVDASGRTVLPGFIDGHTHFQSAALQRAFLIDWMQLRPRTLGEALEVVRKRALALPPGTWLRGDGFEEHYVAEQRFPTCWEIDEVAPDHPTFIQGVGRHQVSANSLALHLAGITRDTPDPPGGRIERDETGEPTGVLRERGKLRLDVGRPDNVLPRYDLEQRGQALRLAIQFLHANGITSIHDIVNDPLEFRAYQQLRQAGGLGVRVQVLLRGIEAMIPLEHVAAVGLLQGFGDQWLRFGGIKMSVDGACISRNAAVYEPYPGEPDNCGLVRIPQDELDEKVGLCHRAGLRVAIHAIGPKAVDMALQALEQALAAEPRAGHRHRIEHAYLPAPAGQLERMARLGIIASTQPSFVDFGDAWIHVWGEDYLPHVMPLRTMLDLGLRVMGSSDFPMVSPNPFLGLKCAVARRTRNGNVLDPREAITVREALRLQTTGAAHGGFEEHLKGSLEPGKLADLVVVSEDPFAVPPEELDRIQVDATVVGGALVFQRKGAMLT
ncbi:MAG: amidohydrolase [Chloroflexi bacterium]|nr:amidohydrolase [Chloroflexota bacterium]